jgi:hypothetical protein
VPITNPFKGVTGMQPVTPFLSERVLRTETAKGLRGSQCWL